MELEVLDQDEHNLRFIIKGISIEMVNALRRIMLSWIPCMAVDEVIILKNDSPLYDDILAHRIGLIPLTTDLEVYNLPEDCECGGFGCS
jgi:DNA-directed RNA polymerase subunit D